LYLSNSVIIYLYSMCSKNTSAVEIQTSAATFQSILYINISNSSEILASVSD